MSFNTTGFSLKRKFRILIVSILLSIIIGLTLIYSNISNQKSIVSNSVDSVSQYINNYLSNDEETLDIIEDTYEFDYKNFNDKHPLNSQYSADIRQLFSYLNIENNDESYQLDSNTLNIDSLINYDFADKVIEKDILNHKYTPFNPYYKTLLNSKTQSLDDISQSKPYDLDPMLYWNFILRQIEQNVEYIDFYWYDFINNVEYNNFLRNIHNNKEIHDSINCSFLNDEIFDLNILNSLDLPIFFYQYKDYQTMEFIDEHKDKKANESLLSKSCKIIEEDLENQLFNPKILQTNVNFEVRPEVYHLQSMNRIFNSLDKPLSIGLINIKDNSFKQVFVNNTPTSIGDNFLNSGLFNKLKDSFQVDDVELLNSFENIDFMTLDKMFSLDDLNLTHLTEDAFEFNLEEKYYELLSMDDLSPNQLHYLDSLKNNMNSHYAFQSKYFQEANEVVNTYGKGFHHDHRFFRSQVSADVATLKTGILQGMLKTFTSTLKALGITGWMSHGNMYGWMYNGLPFPYDDDIDFQMPLKHMHILAEHFNQSVLLQDPRFGNGRYFLDFGNLGGRTHGNGNNNIDGRLIDMDTGLYIDITGLSFNGEIISPKLYLELASVLDEHITETKHDDQITYDFSYFKDQKDHSLSELEQKLSDDEIQRYVDENFQDDFKDKAKEFVKNTLKNEKEDFDSFIKAGKKIFASIKDEDKDEFERKYNKVLIYLNEMNKHERYAVNKKLGLVTCRNKHFVNVEDYKTLINTFYQQSPIILPVNYMDLLHNEYKVPSKYDYLEYKGYMFQPNLNAWMKSEYVENALKKKHYKPWFYNTEDEIDNFKLLKVDSDLKRSSLLSLEETEILLFNMCDFDDKSTMTVEEFNVVVDITNWASQFPQTQYRFKELSLLNDLDKRSVINPRFINSTQHLYNALYEKMIDFEIGKVNDGNNKLYKDSFEFLKDLELLHGHEIYGYDMTDICRSHILPIMKNLEDGKFKEVEFLGDYNFVGKDVWVIPGDNEHDKEVYKSYDHNIYSKVD
ncbi:uncharacterized protein HGUI_00127 [Hanseniaspora guilliermondii]|uniref:LicD/FKTN/FKRP nucleotidyltransferase domain-containing protein n=1 Tax=Hanseniaspora guilliermondii TaxID=56406 RepID=A0A1L0CT46_9ASCO|nr:uncharacterized protein HGUI_00127 [Hanseniaspora guilliermondii]